MKRLLGLLLLLGYLLIPTQIYSSSEDRDTLLAIYNAMPKDTIRIKQLQGEFRKNIGQSWSIELLDILLPASQALNYVEGELEATLGYCDYYGYKSDVPNMLHWFEELKKAAYKYNEFDLFYRKWRVISDYKIKQGESETVLLEAKKVKNEAIEKHRNSGVFYANLTIATALDMVENFDEAFKVYDELLADQSINDYEKAEVHWMCSKTYLKTDQSQKAVDEINQSTQLLLAYYDQHKEVARNNDKLLEKEVGLCRIFARIGDTTNLYKHLKQAEQYYTPHSYPSLKLGYCNYWTQYYTLKEDWEESLKRYDITFALFDGTMPLYEMSLYIDKAAVLRKANRFKESAETYKHAAELNESINRKIQHANQEALQANYAINQALIERANIERKQNILTIGITATLCLLLMTLLIKKLDANRKLKHRKQETKRLLEIARLENKEKESFLRNISHQIRIPLHTVVGLSDVLSNETTLTEEEKQVCAQSIKTDADELSELVNKVLYLARLESGMMRLQIEVYDMVQLCRDAAAIVAMRREKSNHITLHFSDKQLLAETDSEQFLKIITALLTQEQEDSKLETKLSLAPKENDAFALMIEMGTPTKELDESDLQEKINKAFARLFHGTFTTHEVGHTTLLTFVLPYKQPASTGN